MIVVVTLVLGGVLRNMLLRFFSRLQLDKLVKKQFGVSFALGRTITYCLVSLVYFAGFLWALSELGVSIALLRWIFVVFASVVLVLALLAFKDFLPNLFAGLYILVTKKLKVGDTLHVDSVKGKVVGFTLVETRVAIAGGDIIFLPNSLLMKQKVTLR